MRDTTVGVVVIFTIVAWFFVLRAALKKRHHFSLKRKRERLVEILAQISRIEQKNQELTANVRRVVANATDHGSEHGQKRRELRWQQVMENKTLLAHLRQEMDELIDKFDSGD
jgi:biopolymer transport protein ExbB/TolQ